MIIIMIIIACSRRSDRGDSAAFPALPLPFFLLIFFSLSSFAPHSIIQKLSKRLEQAMIIITKIIIIIMMTIYIIIILCDDDDDDDDDKYLFSLESLIFL